MAKGGAQSVPGVTMGSAYRFATGELVGFVYKHRHGHDEWEAIIVGTSIAARRVTRREAVEAALASI